MEDYVAAMVARLNPSGPLPPLVGEMLRKRAERSTS
jgi:hypothetical protein